MATHGKTGYVVFAGATICATSWAIDRSLDEVDVTTFCSTGDYKEYISGFSEVTGSFTTLDANNYYGATALAIFGNDLIEYSGTILVTKCGAKNDIDSRFEHSWDFRGTGPMTISE